MQSMGLLNVVGIALLLNWGTVTALVGTSIIDLA